MILINILLLFVYKKNEFCYTPVTNDFKATVSVLYCPFAHLLIYPFTLLPTPFTEDESCLPFLLQRHVPSRRPMPVRTRGFPTICLHTGDSRVPPHDGPHPADHELLISGGKLRHMGHLVEHYDARRGIW